MSQLDEGGGAADSMPCPLSLVAATHGRSRCPILPAATRLTAPTKHSLGRSREMGRVMRLTAIEKPWSICQRAIPSLPSLPSSSTVSLVDALVAAQRSKHRSASFPRKLAGDLLVHTQGDLQAASLICLARLIGCAPCGSSAPEQGSSPHPDTVGF